MMDCSCCPHTDVHEDARNGCVVCCACGVVLSAYISSEPEWRDPSRERCDTWPADTHRCGGTEIYGNSLMAKMNKSLVRVNRTLYEDTERVQGLCSSLALSDAVCKRACDLMQYVRKHSSGVWRGNRRIALRAACLSLTCKEFSIGITDHEIVSSEHAKVPIKSLNKQKKFILILQHGNDCMPRSEHSYSEFGRRFCVQMGFDDRLTCMVCSRAEQLASHAKLKSKPPNLVMTVAIVHMLKNTYVLDIERLCVTAGVTTPTISKWYADAFNESYSVARSILRCRGP